MFTILIRFAVISTALITTNVFGYGWQIFTDKDHIPPPFVPPLTDKIGEVAGFEALGLFLALGGFGCPGDIVAQINARNESYLGTEYLPRYREARGIWAWLDAKHLIYTEGEPTSDCPVCGFAHTAAELKELTLEKCARLNALSAEIDAIWVEHAEACWELVPTESWEQYMAWLDAHR